MNILINALSARLGGGQTYIRNILNDSVLSENNFCIYLMAPKNLIVESKFIVRLDVPEYCENPFLRIFFEKFRLPSVLKEYEIDVIFCPGGLLSNTSSSGDFKTVTMFRNMIPFDPVVRNTVAFGYPRIRNWLLYHLMLKSMAKADLTIFISDYARSVIENLVMVKKAATIPHGINVLFRQSKLARPEVLPKTEYILYVSRFDVYKHHYELIEGYIKLPENLRKKYKLVFVGETGTDQYERCLDLIKKHNLLDEIMILGAVEYEKLPSFYQNACLNLFASSCENCPNIMLEALASGRPLLSSNVMPMPEFGEDNVAYFSPYNAESIKDCLMEFLSSEEKCIELSEKAKQQSLKYSWDLCAKQTWNEIVNLNKPEHE